MKQYLFLLLIFISSPLSVIFAQTNKNEDLYTAIVNKDKGQVTALIMDHANPNYVKSVSRFNKTNLLITAVKKSDSEIVHMLIDQNVDLEWKDGIGRTALMYAAATGRSNIVQLLIESGANIEANDGKGYNVLAAAKESSNEDLIGLIEDKLEEKKVKK
jgi:ankyrin repeat protein